MEDIEFIGVYPKITSLIETMYDTAECPVVTNGQLK